MASRESPPPVAGLLDLTRLGGTMLAEVLRRGRDASMRQAFRRWAERTTARRGSQNVILKLGPRRVLLVGGAELSRCILHTPPGGGLVAGTVKRKAMSFLAPRALTISDGDEWRRRRAFNEAVLQPGRTHALAADFLARARAAFRAPPVTDVDALRAAMRRAMLGIVFGPDAASKHAQLGVDVDGLFAVVQSPLRRALFGRFARRQRERFYKTLGELWRAPSPAPSLLAVARAANRSPELGLSDDEVLNQIPHWMFTFTGSGTDLLGRTLALILSHPDAKRRLIDELAGVMPDDAEGIDRLPFLEACLLETAHLYPPVTRTFHRTTSPLVMAQVELPRDLEMLQVLPSLEERNGGRAPRFSPERWLGGGPAAGPSFDPFLGGTRRCPGRNLILLVCKVAVSELLTGQQIELASRPLRPEALPPELSLRGLRFRSSAASR